MAIHVSVCIVALGYILNHESMYEESSPVSVSIMKNDQLMLYWDIIVVSCNNLMKHVTVRAMGAGL